MLTNKYDEVCMKVMSLFYIVNCMVPLRFFGCKTKYYTYCRRSEGFMHTDLYYGNAGFHVQCVMYQCFSVTYCLPEDAGSTFL